MVARRPYTFIWIGRPGESISTDKTVLVFSDRTAGFKGPHRAGEVPNMLSSKDTATRSPHTFRSFVCITIVLVQVSNALCVIYTVLLFFRKILDMFKN